MRKVTIMSKFDIAFSSLFPNLEVGADFDFGGGGGVVSGSVGILNI